MSFAGKVWRLLVGVKDALALLFLLLFFSALFMVLTSMRKRPLSQKIVEPAQQFIAHGQRGHGHARTLLAGRSAHRHFLRVRIQPLLE